MIVGQLGHFHFKKIQISASEISSLTVIYIMHCCVLVKNFLMFLVLKMWIFTAYLNK